MTLGTSPHPRGCPSRRWTAADRMIAGARTRVRAWAAMPLARTAALLYLAALAMLGMTAWHHPAAAGGGMLSALPDWHLAFLMATGAGMAVLTLTRLDAATRRVRDGEDQLAPVDGLGELMARLSHELRTPLNAVIGFSELMVQELHGPLGNQRYQQYAHHIAESGGRLLRSSEEALCVTEAMTALITGRRGPRERRNAAELLSDAWHAARSALGDAAPRLAVTGCASCELTCERRPTVEALEHLLWVAAGHAGEAGAIAVTGRSQSDRRSVEIMAKARTDGRPAAKGALRVSLARLLLEMQGATLAVATSDQAWTARIGFL
jgi:signal transduction histidine kinase